MLLNGVPQITQCCTRRDQFQCLIQALLRNTHQPFCVGSHITDAQHDAGVTMPTIFYHGDVDVDDIAAFNRFESEGMPWQMTSLTEVQIDFGNPL